MINFNHIFKKSECGLVLDWRFHKKNKWVCASSGYLINAIIATFDPIIISSQIEYEWHKNKLKYIIAIEPGWSAPRISYDCSIECIKVVFYSDPHNDTQNRLKYFNDNGFDFVLSLYYDPFFRHFKGFPEDKFIYMPWAVPDQFLSTHNLMVRDTTVAIFGGQASDAYDVRNWCRQQACVNNFNFSGVENKVLSDKEYYDWLNRFDAIVAAGSSNPKFDLVTPKYFEIASTGALLIGQWCSDLEKLGFSDENMLIFRSKNDFLDKVDLFKQNPERFLSMRQQARKHIASSHLTSHRVRKIKEVFRIL